MEKAPKIYEEVNIKSLVEAMREEAEEYGQLHEDECPLMQEGGGDFGDVCECPTIIALKQFALEWMARVNQKWVENTKAHLPYCRPDGRKMLIPLYGGKLKTPEHIRKIRESLHKKYHPKP